MSSSHPKLSTPLEGIQMIHSPIAFGLTPAQITKSVLIGLLIFAISPASGEAKFALLIFFLTLLGFRIFGFRKNSDEAVKVHPMPSSEVSSHDHK